MGCSMGGTGALHLGLRYPEVFGAVVSMSSVTMDFEHDPRWQEAAKLYDHDPQGVDDLMTYEYSTLLDYGHGSRGRAKSGQAARVF